MSITAISIKNFRSISSFDDRVRDLNIFVGQNDEGKSNVLRALDLFFTGEKDGGYRFDWQRDYCSFTPHRKGKADEIIIKLEITPPKTFRNRNPVVWKKIWRSGGLEHDSKIHVDRSPVSASSKISAFLKAMRYDYVPAIKGPDYFNRLMSNLYEMMEATLEGKLRSASSSFTATINESTRPILEDIRERLKLDSTIELPANLRSLFAELEFTSVSGDKPFSLNQRGDGIKVRHIPIILRWLAEQANALSAPGKPKSVTVWGYEEPENNLELRRCFDMAQELAASSGEIQCFVTTHSPAFYSVFREIDKTKAMLFHVEKRSDSHVTAVKLLNESHINSLDSSMGLMSLLEPHFAEARAELQLLKEANKTLLESEKPVLLMEGISDKLLVETAWKKLHAGKDMPYEVIACGIAAHPDARSGGAEMLRRCVEFLAIASDRKIVGVFDNDRIGNEQFKGMHKSAFTKGKDKCHRKHKVKNVHCILLPTPSGRELFVSDDISHRYLSIEHYFADKWVKAYGIMGDPILRTAVYEIIGDKLKFAKKTSHLGKEEFSNFQLLLDRLQEILN